MALRDPAVPIQQPPHFPASPETVPTTPALVLPLPAPMMKRMKMSLNSLIYRSYLTMCFNVVKGL